ncbi:MAG: hypothetical protein O9272_12575 [Brevundimonas sp.]|jgi:hypothetical protein|nr:hypothetical protein [Brevundimonas sp.]
MSDFATDRANRHAARKLFEARLAQVKADLAARSIGGRVAAKVRDDARGLVDEGLAVARDNKGLVAATIAALLAWIFRAPLIGWIARRGGPQAPVQPEPANDDMPEQSKEQAL